MSKHVPADKHWHRNIEANSLLFTVLVTIAILIGGLVEIIPLYFIEVNEQQATQVQPYTPLEIAGRDIYVREGCYNCHSQHVRPLHAEVMRYGEWSRSAEAIWDRPFQLGSRRIGPDLAREGDLRPHSWHYDHFYNPRAVVQDSIMPAYKWLYTNHYEVEDIRASLTALRRLGTPYPDETFDNLEAIIREQADEIVAGIDGGAVAPEWNQEVIALIAFMQRLGKNLDAILGTDEEAEEAAAEPEAADEPEEAVAEAEAAGADEADEADEAAGEGEEAEEAEESDEAADGAESDEAGDDAEAEEDTAAAGEAAE